MKKDGSGSRLRPDKRAKQKLTPRLVISRSLIVSGIALMLFAAIYEAANYPWQIYFAKDEDFKKFDALPDPTPPSFAPDAVEYDPVDDYPDITEAPSPDASSDIAVPGAEDFGDFAATADKNIKVNTIGAIKVPKLGISVNIIDGYTQQHLLFGAGHVNGTPLPDEEGNVCISGHRVTAAMHPFRHMELMENGDYVFILYNDHVFTYEAFDRFVIKNNETWVMRRVEEEKYLLTLITCHPPGSARERMILRARLIQVDDKTPEEFFAARTDATPSPSPSPSPSP